MIRLSATDQLLNVYNFLFLFLFDEMFSAELDSSRPGMKWWGKKKSNDLFFKKFSYKGNIITIWKITSLEQWLRQKVLSLLGLILS